MNYNVTYMDNTPTMLKTARKPQKTLLPLKTYMLLKIHPKLKYLLPTASSQDPTSNNIPEPSFEDCLKSVQRKRDRPQSQNKDSPVPTDSPTTTKIPLPLTLEEMKSRNAQDSSNNSLSQKKTKMKKRSVFNSSDSILSDPDVPSSEPELEPNDHAAIPPPLQNILASAASVFDSNPNLPLSFQDFTEFIEHCSKP